MIFPYYIQYSSQKIPFYVQFYPILAFLRVSADISEREFFFSEEDNSINFDPILLKFLEVHPW